MVLFTLVKSFIPFSPKKRAKEFRSLIYELFVFSDAPFTFVRYSLNCSMSPFIIYPSKPILLTLLTQLYDFSHKKSIYFTIFPQKTPLFQILSTTSVKFMFISYISILLAIYISNIQAAELTAKAHTNIIKCSFKCFRRSLFILLLGP